MRVFSMCICVCFENDENVFHATTRTFSMCICVCLDSDENVFHVCLGEFRQR